MNRKFEKAFEAVIGHEGGLSLDPKDDGNWTGGAAGVGVLKGTKYGISAASYPSLDIRNLTLDDAKEIYKRDFWDPLLADHYPYRVGFNLFDGAVNSGHSRSVTWGQKAVGVTQDGDLGPITFAALQAERNTWRFNARYNAARQKSLVTFKTWPEHGRGWINRTSTNLEK